MKMPHSPITKKDYLRRVREICWDCDYRNPGKGTVISRAINFGGFDFIEEVMKRYGKKKFVDVLVNRRGLNKQAVNYWCMQFGIDVNETMTFKTPVIWTPF